MGTYIFNYSNHTGVLGFSGIAGAATNIAWVLFVVGIILAIIFMITGRRPRV